MSGPIVTPEGDLIAVGADGVGRVILKKPVVCGCKRVAYFIVNRHGKSRCAACDAEHVVAVAAGGPRL